MLTPWTQLELADPVARRSRRRWLLPIAAGAMLAIGLAAGITIAANHDGKPNSNATATATQLADVTQACRSWMNASTPSGATPTWCDEMSRWMNQQTTGSSHTTGSAMWGDPDRMRATCRTWMASTNGTATGTTPTACDDMVTWMQQRPQTTGTAG